MYCQLVIKHNGKQYIPIVLDGIRWETARKGEPGKLTFTVVKDELLNFQEGNPVELTVDGKPIFRGYVFEKRRNKNQHISVTAYDQLRYFKNKHVRAYENKTAAEVIKMLASDFKLTVGELADTMVKIPARMEDNVTLFDMAQNALDITLKVSGKLYVLYDDFGKLTLKNIEDMKLKTVIDAETAEDFDYSSSIDGETYNTIVVFYDTGEGKIKNRNYQVKQDAQRQKEWGVLQLVEKADNAELAAAKAEGLLQLHNRKTRRLSIKGALGDTNVRAGASLPINLNLGDIVVNSYLVANRVVHTFTDNQHTMDIDFIGGITGGEYFVG